MACFGSYISVCCLWPMWMGRSPLCCWSYLQVLPASSTSVYFGYAPATSPFDYKFLLRSLFKKQIKTWPFWITGSSFALHVNDPCSIRGNTYGPQVLPQMVPDQGVSSEHGQICTRNKTKKIFGTREIVQIVEHCWSRFYPQHPIEFPKHTRNKPWAQQLWDPQHHPIKKKGKWSAKWWKEMNTWVEGVVKKHCMHKILSLTVCRPHCFEWNKSVNE